MCVFKRTKGNIEWCLSTLTIYIFNGNLKELSVIKYLKNVVVSCILLVTLYENRPFWKKKVTFLQRTLAVLHGKRKIIFDTFFTLPSV